MKTTREKTHRSRRYESQGESPPWKCLGMLLEWGLVLEREERGERGLY